MTRCPKCRKMVPGRARHCAYCGARLPSLAAQWLARVDWPFLGRWLLASGGFCALAWVLLTHPALVGLLDLPPGPLVTAAQAIIAGLVIGAGQWFVLRPRVHDSRAWLLALPAGWTAAFALWAVWPAVSASPPPWQLASGAVVPLLVIGAVAGYAQWPLARRYTWPASRWALASALAAAGTAILVALAAPAAEGGWFTRVALRAGGGAVFAWSDVSLAAAFGLALGAGQSWQIRHSVPLAPLWPLASATGAAAGALLLDGLFELAQYGIVGLGDPAITVPWYTFAGGPAGAAIAWGLTGLGLGAGQWLFLRLAAALPASVAIRAGVAPGPGRPEGPQRLWLPLAGGGAAAGALIAWPLASAGWLLLGATLAGLTAGFPQFLATRAHFPRPGWLLATQATGWCLLALLSELLGQPLFEMAFGVPLLTAVLALLPGFVLAVR